MAKFTSYLNKCLSLFLILILHLGCFFFSSSAVDNTTTTLPQSFHKRKRKFSSALLPSFNPSKAISSSWSYIRRTVFQSPSTKFHSKSRTATKPGGGYSSSPTILRSSTHSNIFNQQDQQQYPNNKVHQSHDESIISSDHSVISVPPPRKRRSSSKGGIIMAESDKSDNNYSLLENPFFPLRNDIYPCPNCGEVFQKCQLLEQHQTIKHAVSELYDGDSGKNIVWIIFNSGWVDRYLNPRIHRILKIHNSSKILSWFEEYRDIVRSRASRSGNTRDERCIADGNELLRFHCTTLICNLGSNGNTSLCNQQYCSICGIIRSGFSPKLDGISTLATSWRAHVSIPNDVEEEFGFMNVKRAMLVCRVIAGRISGCDPMIQFVNKEDPGFDSIAGSSSSGTGHGGGNKGTVGEEDELLVFNPRAVLPCFVIVYSV